MVLVATAAEIVLREIAPRQIVAALGHATGLQEEEEEEETEIVADPTATGATETAEIAIDPKTAKEGGDRVLETAARVRKTARKWKLPKSKWERMVSRFPRRTRNRTRENATGNAAAVETAKESAVDLATGSADAAGRERGAEIDRKSNRNPWTATLHPPTRRRTLEESECRRR